MLSQVVATKSQSYHTLSLFHMHASTVPVYHASTMQISIWTLQWRLRPMRDIQWHFLAKYLLIPLLPSVINLRAKLSSQLYTHRSADCPVSHTSQPPIKKFLCRSADFLPFSLQFSVYFLGFIMPPLKLQLICKSQRIRDWHWGLCLGQILHFHTLPILQAQATGQ